MVTVKYTFLLTTFRRFQCYLHAFEFETSYTVCPQNRFFVIMKILFAFFIYLCKAQNRIDIGNSAAPRCYLCYQYAMMRGQDFIKREKNDDGCDRLISTTEIVEPRINHAFGNYKAQTVCFYAHSTGTMRLVKQK